MTDNDKWATPYNEIFTGGQVPANEFSLSDSLFAAPVNQGGSATTTVGTSVVAGTAQTVTLSASGLPPGVTATFNPSAVTAGGSSTRTLQASATAALGTATVTVTGTSPSVVHSVPLTLTVNVAGSGGTIVSGGSYEIHQGTQVVDVPGSSTSTGTQLIVWGAHGGAN